MDCVPVFQAPAALVTQLAIARTGDAFVDYVVHGDPRDLQAVRRLQRAGHQIVATPVRLGAVPIVSSIVSDVGASTRASLYNELAKFQALPARLNRVTEQLVLFSRLTPMRSVAESNTLSSLQSMTVDAQQRWRSTNADVSHAIASIDGGLVGAIGSVAKAVAGITLMTQATHTLEQRTRQLVSDSPSLSPAQRTQIDAIGVGTSFGWGHLLLVAAGLAIAVKVLR